VPGHEVQSHQQQFAAVDRHTDPDKIPPFLSLLAALNKSKPYYQLGIILDKQGRVLVTTADSGVGTSRVDREYFKEAMRGKWDNKNPGIHKRHL